VELMIYGGRKSKNTRRIFIFVSEKKVAKENSNIWFVRSDIYKGEKAYL